MENKILQNLDNKMKDIIQMVNNYLGKKLPESAFGSIGGQIFEDEIEKLLLLLGKVEKQPKYKDYNLTEKNSKADFFIANTFIECKKTGITGGYKKIDEMKKLQDKCIKNGFNFICIIGPGETNTYRRKTKEKGINAFWLTDKNSWYQIVNNINLQYK